MMNQNISGDIYLAKHINVDSALLLRHLDAY